MRTSVCAAAVILLASCASPTGPRAELPLTPGVYVVEMLSVAQLCSGWPTSQVGWSAMFQATLSQDGTAWVGRPTDSAQGDFEFVVRPTTAVATSSFTYFEGTFLGSAVDNFRPFPSLAPISYRVARVTPAGGPAVAIDGAVNLGGQFNVADIKGPVEFIRGGESVVCPAGSVKFSFQRTP